MWPPNSWALFAFTIWSAALVGLVFPFPWFFIVAGIIAATGAVIDERMGR